MSEEPDRAGFIGRWSRLKRRRLEAVPEVATPPEVVAPEAAAVEIPPPAETIPLEDITAWLGRNVPEGWREAALRRVWSADASIRDFVGPADYAWDWNTPGGAPGWGPIRAADDLVRALARAMGEDLPKPEGLEPVVMAEISPEPAAAEALPVTDEPPLAVTQEPPAPVVPRRGGRAAPV